MASIWMNDLSKFYTEIFKGILLTTAFFGIASFQALAADTAAEAAAMSERVLVPQEIEQLEAACKLSLSDKAIGLNSNHKRRELVEFADFRVLPLILIYELNEKAGVKKYEDLPKGGIARRDFCAAVVLKRFPPLEFGQLSVIFGLWLRPGLDLENDYPTAYAEISSRNQMIDLSSLTFVVVESELEDLTDSEVVEIIKNEKIETEAYYFSLQGKHLMPLKNSALRD